MKINKRFKPELCASKDKARHNITEPWLDTKRGKIVATDGHMMVAVPVEIEKGDEPGYIGSALRRLREKKNTALGTFPDWEKAVPNIKPGSPGTMSIGLNAAYLLAIAKAIDAKEHGVVLTFRVDGQQASLDPVSVRACSGHDDGVLAALMPMRID